MKLQKRYSTSQLEGLDANRVDQFTARNARNYQFKENSARANQLSEQDGANLWQVANTEGREDFERTNQNTQCMRNSQWEG